MQTKHYYIYSHFDFTQGSAGTTRMLYYAQAIADQNNKVYLISCCTDRLSIKSFIEISPNIFVLKDKKLTKNPFQVFKFVRRLRDFANRQVGKQVFLHYPFPLISLELISLCYLKLIKRESLYTELNEIRKHTSHFHSKVSIRKPKYSLKKIVFKTIFTFMEPLISIYDGVVCISSSIETYAKKFNKNSLRVPILTNPYMVFEKSNKKYATNGVINIGFSGSIHPTKENLENFIDIIKKLKEQGLPISFNLCGSIFNDYKERFESIYKLREEISYFGNLDSKQFSSFLSQQDILVLPRGFSLQNKYGFSTKLSDYLNHKKITIVTDISDNGLYIKDGINGFIVPPDNDFEMYKKLKFVIENLNILYKKVIPNAIKTSREHFYYLNYSEPLRQFLH